MTRQFLSEEIALQKVEAGDGGREPREVLVVCYIFCCEVFGQ